MSTNKFDLYQADTSIRGKMLQAGVYVREPLLIDETALHEYLFGIVGAKHVKVCHIVDGCTVTKYPFDTVNHRVFTGERWDDLKDFAPEPHPDRVLLESGKKKKWAIRSYIEDRDDSDIGQDAQITIKDNVLVFKVRCGDIYKVACRRINPTLYTEYQYYSSSTKMWSLACTPEVFVDLFELFDASKTIYRVDPK